MFVNVVKFKKRYPTVSEWEHLMSEGPLQGPWEGCHLRKEQHLNVTKLSSYSALPHMQAYP